MKLSPAFSLFLTALVLFGCQKRKLTEVVEVPLPAAEEKISIGHPEDVSATPGAFAMYKLPFSYDALAPQIDAMTLENHYSKHYLTYTNNLNQLLAGTAQENLPIEEIHKKLDMSNSNLRNNLGGYYNHTLMWEILSPKPATTPSDTLAVAINASFGSFENLKTELEKSASDHFGSGWAWLVVNRSKKLQVCNTSNQDNPLMPQSPVPGTPILGIDVWEHAYYLGYQYRRKKYVEACLKLIDWAKVSEKYEDAIRRKY